MLVKILKRKIKTLRQKPGVLFIKVWRLFEPFVSDSLFLRVVFRFKVGYWPNLKNPKSYNEKLQWLKLYNKNSEYTQLVDKIAVKDFVAKVIGKDYLIPTIGIWNSIDEINWNNLPNRFVLKASHDSGGIVICKNRLELDLKDAKAKLLNAGKRNYAKYNKEYVYQNVPHRFIAEQYMEDESGFELKDYKIFCYGGKAQYLFVATGRQKNDTRFDFYDTDFNHLPVLNGHPNADEWPVKPKNFKQMIEVAEKLAQNIPQVRVDLYNINGKIYFGEMTFFHWSGLTPFEPREWDFKFGEKLILPTLKA